MDFVYSGTGLAGKQRVLQRIFEIVPGLTSWTILIGMAALSFFKPLVADNDNSCLFFLG